MNISSKIAATVVAVLCLLALSSVPALALSAGNINMSFNTASSAPQIVSITPATTSVVCTPDGTTPLIVTVVCFDAGGGQQLGALQMQLKSGDVNAGTVVTVASGTSTDAKDASYVVTTNFQYYWLHSSRSTTLTAELVQELRLRLPTCRQPVSPLKRRLSTLGRSTTAKPRRPITQTSITRRTRPLASEHQARSS